MVTPGADGSGMLPRASRDAQINPRVTSALEDRAPLTVIRGPRGYGKTTALVRWLTSDTLDRPARYVRLGVEERLAGGFWRLLRAELALAGVEMPSGEDDRVVTCQGLLLHRTPLVLVLDDFHEAGRLEGARDVDEDLVDLVRRNDQLELVIATRALRDIETTGALSVDARVIRPTDLALTPDLVVALARRRGLVVSPEHAGRLAAELGGWPAAVRACIESAAMSGSDAVVDSALVDDYLFGLLEDMPAEGLREFLLRTSVPEEFSDATAQAIVPDVGTPAMLRNLRASGLISRRMTVAGPRYSYPPAVREALVRILGETRPHVVREVHLALISQAAREEGPPGVLRHACLAREWDVALAIIDEEWATLVTRHPDTLIEAVQEIPDHLVAAHPRLTIVRSELPKGIRPGPRSASWQPTDPAFLSVASRLRAAETAETSDHAMVLVQWGASAILAGDNDTALYAFARVRERGIETDDLSARLMGTTGMLLARAIIGDVDHALAWARDSELADVLHGHRRDGLTDLVQIVARIAYAIASVDGVTDDVDAAVEAVVEPRRRDDVWALAVFARAHLATIDPDEEVRARHIGALRAALRHTETGGITEATLATTLAELLVLSGMTSGAEEVLDSLVDGPVAATPRVQLLLAQGRPREAIRVAESVLASPTATRRAQLTCEVGIAWALEMLGETTAARRAFTRAVQTARETGQRRAFSLVPPATFASLAGGDPAALALRPQRGEDADVAAVVPAVVAPRATLDHLSAREVDVLVALRTNTGPAGIAAELGISPNTAKTHLRRVYHKLGASSRQEALRISAHWPGRGSAGRSG